MPTDPNTGPPLNLVLPTVGADSGAWGALLNANLQAINAWAAGLGQITVYELVDSFGPPDGATVNKFASPVPLSGATKCLMIYNGVVLDPADPEYGFALSGTNNTVVTFTFFPESTANLRVAVIG